MGDMTRVMKERIVEGLIRVMEGIHKGKACLHALGGRTLLEVLVASHNTTCERHRAHPQNEGNAQTRGNPQNQENVLAQGITLAQGEVQIKIVPKM